MSRELDHPGVLQFLTFVLPLIVDTLFNKAAPFLFAPSMLQLMQNKDLGYQQVHTLGSLFISGRVAPWTQWSRPSQDSSWGLESRRLESRAKAAARLDFEVSAGWASPSPRGLWGGDALLHQQRVLFRWFLQRRVVRRFEGASWWIVSCR
jgi:hypothetical protein